MRPTDQQEHVLDLVREGGDIAVEAGAGCGKTTTLRMIAETKRRSRGRYTAFNKSLVTDAQGKFPSNVRVTTVHAMAMGQVGNPFRPRLDDHTAKSDRVGEMLGLESQAITYNGTTQVLTRGYLASLARRAVENFCQSDDVMPEPHHVPYIDGIDPPENDGRRTWANNLAIRRYLTPYLETVWEDAQDPKGRLPYRHSYYLKVFQLSGKRLPVDFLLVDEAQDLPPVMRAIFLRQDHCQRVFVGDSNQAIYGWLGAVNALDDVPAKSRAYLTNSFRFGPGIALANNRVLEALRAPIRLTGVGSPTSRLGREEEPAAILTRNNATAFDRMIEYLDLGLRPFLIGGGDDLVKFAKGALEIKQTGRTAYARLAIFQTWAQVQEYAEKDPMGMTELALLVKLVDAYTPERVIDVLGHMTAESEADLAIGTTHSAKGREWQTVVLADDFPEASGTEELRVLYVAGTRAMEVLDVNGCDAFRTLLADRRTEGAQLRIVP
jgi:hypothetical protein